MPQNNNLGQISNSGVKDPDRELLFTLLTNPVSGMGDPPCNRISTPERWHHSKLVNLLPRIQKFREDDFLRSLKLPDYASTLLDNLKQLWGNTGLDSLDGCALLAMRQLHMHLDAPAQKSANGSCLLLECLDKQWIALNLARESDLELLPALFAEHETTALQVADPEKNLAQTCIKIDAAYLVERGRLLGLAISQVNEAAQHQAIPTWYQAIHEDKSQSPHNTLPKVLDLSSLWAGPLCSKLLALAGATVTRVESVTRPDISRQHSPDFFNWLNKGKEKKILDFRNPDIQTRLHSLIKDPEPCNNWDSMLSNW
jgi:hypothetical protein